MEKNVVINLSNEEIAEEIFNKDSNDIAKILGLVHKKFEDNFYQNKDIIWDSYGMCLHVTEGMNEDTKHFIENLYHAMWYRHGKEILENNKINIF